jgi:hypothetical protein
MRHRLHRMSVIICKKTAIDQSLRAPPPRSPSDADDVTSNSNSLLFLSASVYALACSNSLNTLTSLFLSFSSGCECTRLCKADAAFLLASGSRSDCTIWTSSGMHPDCLMARQLSGLVLNARRVSPMSACSWPLNIANRLYTMSTLASSCWEERRDKLGLPRRAPPELDAKLITLVSSCGTRASDGGRHAGDGVLYRMVCVCGGGRSIRDGFGVPHCPLDGPSAVVEHRNAVVSMGDGFAADGHVGAGASGPVAFVFAAGGVPVGAARGTTVALKQQKSTYTMQHIKLAVTLERVN